MVQTRSHRWKDLCYRKPRGTLYLEHVEMERGGVHVSAEVAEVEAWHGERKGSAWSSSTA